MDKGPRASPVRGVPIAGDVCTFHFRIDAEQYDEREGSLFQRVIHEIPFLQKEISQMVSQTLGDTFELRDIRIQRGSVDFYIVFGTVGVVYYTFAYYHHFVESIELLFRQVRALLNRFTNRAVDGPTNYPDLPWPLHGSWTLSPAVRSAVLPAPGATMSIETLLLAYILVTHALLLGIVVWKFLHP